MLVALDRNKPKPRGWHRQPCTWPSCRCASERGRLCSTHHAAVLAVSTARLAPFGIAPDKAAVSPDGYISVRINGSFIPEHRVVMAVQLGRELLSSETVHHKNGNRADNRADNLELWVSAQPVGQRPADLLAYAHEIVGRYGQIGGGI